jgi:hypothetical protein
MHRIIGTDKHAIERLIHHPWQLHTAYSRIIGRGTEARFAVGINRLFDLGNSFNLAIHKLGLIGI